MKPILKSFFIKLKQKVTILFLRVKSFILRQDVRIKRIIYVDNLISKGGMIEIQWDVSYCYKIEIKNGPTVPGNSKGVSLTMDGNPVTITFNGRGGRNVKKTIHFNENQTVLINKFQYQTEVKDLQYPLKEVARLKHTLNKEISPTYSTRFFKTRHSTKDWHVSSALKPVIQANNGLPNINIQLNESNVPIIHSLIEELQSINHAPFDINQYTSES